MSRREKDDWDEDSSNPGHRKYKRRASSSDHHMQAMADTRGFWARVRGWVLRLIGGESRPLLPPARRPWDEYRPQLSKSTLEDLDALPPQLAPELVEILGAAIEDFVHLKELVDSGSLKAAAVGEQVLLEEAEAALEDVAERSLPVATLTSLAKRRADDGNAQDAGDIALESIRSVGNVLHEATSAAILYAASLNEEDASSLSQHADELHLLVEAHREIDQELLNG